MLLRKLFVRLAPLIVTLTVSVMAGKTGPIALTLPVNVRLAVFVRMLWLAVRLLKAGVGFPVPRAGVNAMPFKIVPAAPV